MTASTLVRSARIAAGLDQSALSARSRVSQPAISQIEANRRQPNFDTVDRLLSSIGYGVIAVPTRRGDTAFAASRIGDALKADNDQRALRAFLQLNDDLVAESAELRFALCVSPPPTTGSRRWDAALAGLVELRLSEAGFPLPRWTAEPGRSLARAWTFGVGRYVTPVDRERVPAAFRARGVLIDPETLESA